ncbi:MAG: DinB family protein [Bacteroidetes bacterium]|nr:MAG: DinB family protein [Bacteroidota bacterium]
MERQTRQRQAILNALRVSGRSLSPAEFVQPPEGKWSAGQQIEHICRSVSPVILAFRLPVFVLRLAFGKANRPSRSYEEVITKYKAKLSAGGRASGPYVPPPVAAGEQQQLRKKLNALATKLAALTEKHSEAQLDTYLLPHPLLGKMTLREMLYFTSYHVVHHHEAVLRGLGRDQAASA